MKDPMTDSINANHSDIIKFANPSDQDSSITESRLMRLVDDVPGVVGDRTAGHRKKLSDIEARYVKALNAPNFAAFREYSVEDPAPGTLWWFL
ncbi:hypothetical protein FGG08_004502 [Glutinoglossum americanum]|uniref:Uncharacterized protein n=1 Tax=Glutinoglossum americanum TaxID=1670608 RepID=A0A9P8I073_9PEZI|nr:hypothetical protein FGG08_004502 [Glutinoglossum americanum]